MFKHSIKVPRIYKSASKVAKLVKEEGASLKDQIYQIRHNNLKGIYALVATLLQNSNTLDYIIRSTQILIKENRLDPWLARVLITELLWGKKRLPNDSKPCQTVLNYSKELTDCLATFSDDASHTTTKETNKVQKPRYVRVNTLKLSTSEAINIFRDEGWTLLRCGNNTDYGSFLATVASLSDDQFIVDMHIKDLLIFPPNTTFYNHHLYLNGDIVLQDKASCLAPLFLAPEPKSSVLDMCSAPGMKASQLAAIIGKEGTVYAIERDLRRYQTLVQLTENMGAENVKCINKDVMTITNKDIPDVEYILVDPSCSGSGMVDRQVYEDADAKCNKSRLESLAGFQITILRHALNNFPKAKRVVYSTCSKYSEENESVVQQVITTIKDYKLVDLSEKMKPKWFNFGSDDFGDIGKRCLYAIAEQDHTNGFFVALFERLENDETNEFFVRRVKRSSECEHENQQKQEGDKENDNPEPKSKKKKKFDQETNQVVEGKRKKKIDAPEEPTIIIKKKKNKLKHNENEENISEESEESNKKKKKKSKPDKNDYENISEETKPKKKKSKNIDINITQDDEIKQKKKKKSKNLEENNESSFTVDDTTSENICNEVKSKKKKKSKNTQDIPDEKKEKKKKSKKLEDPPIEENKKRKKKHDNDEIKDEVIKKKKKSKSTD